MKDLKYLAALTIPLSAIIGLYFKGVWCYLTPVYAFVFIPILELLLPQNNTNLTKETAKNRTVNTLFDWLLYLNVPIVFGVLIWILLEVSLSSLETFEFVGFVLTIGMMFSANGINVAHELGHRQTTNERFLGKLLLLPSLYMHFYIEHNHGHHLHAATKEDPATARYNQSVYSFWVTSVFRRYISAWKIQMKLLKINKRNFLSVKNDMFWFTILQASYLSIVFSVLGKTALLFAILSAITGFLLLETVNYI